MGGDLSALSSHFSNEIIHVQFLPARYHHKGTDADIIVVRTEGDEVDIPLPEHLFQGPDVGGHKGSLLETIDHVGQQHPIRFEEAFELHGKFFGGQVIRNRKIVEGISEDKIIGPLVSTVHHKPTAVLVKGANFGALRNAQLFFCRSGDLRVDLHHIDLCLGILCVDETGKGITSPSEKEGF